MKSSFYLHIITLLFGCLIFIQWFTDNEPIPIFLPLSILLICIGLVNTFTEFGRFGYALFLRYMTGVLFIYIGLTYSPHPLIWGGGLFVLITAMIDQYWPAKK